MVCVGAAGGVIHKVKWCIGSKTKSNLGVHNKTQGSVLFCMAIFTVVLRHLQGLVKLYLLSGLPYPQDGGTIQTAL